MLKVLFFVLFLICDESVIESKIDFEWDDKMQGIDPDLKCGIENKYKNSAKSRIINGIETSNIKYPWMVEIFRIYQIQPNSPETDFGRCGGSIVSDKSIIKGIFEWVYGSCTSRVTEIQ